MKYLLFFCTLLMPALYADLPQLTVTGEASLNKPADRLHLTLGVETFDPDAQKAIQQNSQKMEKVRQDLLKAGLTDSEIETKNYSVVPRYQPTPDKPSPRWQPAIIGYEVRNTLEITTQKLSAAGTLIDVAAKAGTNFVEGIRFSLKNEEQAKAEAIALAVRHARLYAQAAAQEAGAPLGSLAEINVQSSHVPISYYKTARTYSAESTTPITPSDIEITASVTLVYNLQGANAPV